MLLRFSTSNFTSVRDLQEISLIASSLSDDQSGVIQTPNQSENLLRVAAIYGPNASGKTNFLSALRFMRNAVCNSHTRWQPTKGISIQQFVLDDSHERPSEFAIDFLVDSIRYEYGFSLDSSQILSEYLYAYPEKRRQLWFERNAGDSRINFGKNLTGENRTIESLIRPNSLFLSAAAQNNHEKLLPIFKWFTNSLEFRMGMLGPGGYDQTIELCKKSEETKRTVERLLAGADLGIVSIDITDEPQNDKMNKFVEKFHKLLSEVVDNQNDIPAFSTPVIRKVALKHKAGNDGTVPISIDNESAGTLAYLGLIGPALETLSNGGVLCIDEIDASLHPLLVEEVVKIFNQNETNPTGAQLIFTTHSTELLGTGILRRDQIWFTEKDENGATKLYPMSDFKPRKNENLQRGYLQGRYGATPFIRASDLMEING